jgi:glucose-1-phosphate thymidylyltransferase
VVGPETALGRGAQIGAAAVVEASVLDADTTVGANATVRDCVTGEGATLGPGVAVPGGPGDVRVESTVHERTPLGGLVADRATVAGGAIVAPGTLIGPEARVETGALARDRVAAETIVTR